MYVSMQCMQRVRTTITLPEHLLQQAKIAAVKRKKPLSVIMEVALEKEIKPEKAKKDIMSLMGKYKIGINSALSRKEIYAEHLKHIMSR